MQALSTAGQLDWQGWRLGIVRSVIQGGAHAVVGGMTLTVYDPKDFGIASIPTALHALGFMVTVFLLGGILRMMFYLNDHPLADVQTVQTTTTVQETVQRVVTPPTADTKQ